MFGGLLEKGRKLQLADINLAVTGSRGTITTPSPGDWHNIGRFNIGGVTGNPPIRQI